jgi:hypothetical protein
MDERVVDTSTEDGVRLSRKRDQNFTRQRIPRKN